MSQEPERHLAQLNIGRLIAPIDDPRIVDFANALDAINGLAARSPGFVWRFTGDIDVSSAPTLRFLPDQDRITGNMSVWETADDLRHYVFNTMHRKFYERRGEWFELMAERHLVLWWVEPGHKPTMEEAAGRLDRLRRDGPTDHAFGWEQLPNADAWRVRRCAA